MEYPIYIFLEFLEQEIVKNNQVNNSFGYAEVGGMELSYEIVDDDTIMLNYGWSSHEEDDNNSIEIKFTLENIEIIHKHDGHSCYGGDFSCVNNFIFNDESELINYIKTDLN